MTRTKSSPFHGSKIIRTHRTLEAGVRFVTKENARHPRECRCGGYRLETDEATAEEVHWALEACKRGQY